jgi:hypothetical protein
MLHRRGGPVKWSTAWREATRLKIDTLSFLLVQRCKDIPVDRESWNGKTGGCRGSNIYNRVIEIKISVVFEVSLVEEDSRWLLGIRFVWQRPVLCKRGTIIEGTEKGTLFLCNLVRIRPRQSFRRIR